MSVPRIYAITVSKNYSKILKIMLEKNAKFFEKWFIITQEDDEDTVSAITSANKKNVETIFYPLVPECVKKHHAKCNLKGDDAKFSIPTWLKPDDKKPNPHQQKKIDELRQRGLIFDKGGAIRYVQKKVLPNEPIEDDDLVLLLDSDIILPENFLEHINKKNFNQNTIYGAKREDFVFFEDFQKGKRGIRYETYEGAGYFQLYKRSCNNFCKRTYDCGWVDIEFKNQFNINKIINIFVSHLGLPDMNWEGKTTECFLFRHEYKSYCNNNEVNYIESDLEETKKLIKMKIETNRLHRLQSKVGFPQYYFFGFPRTGLENFVNNLDECDELLKGMSTFNKTLNFFEHEEVCASNWNKGNQWYMAHFPRTLGKKWFDYSTDLVYSFDNSKERLKKIFVDWFWDGFDQIKFLFYIREPIKRYESHYYQYAKYFPSSYAWDWCNPGESLKTNILTELSSIEDENSNCGFFLKSGRYIKYIKEIQSLLNLNKNQICVVAIEQLYGDNSNYHHQRVENFLQISKIPRLNYEPTDKQNNLLSDEESLLLMDYYKKYNEELYNFLGYEIEEWKV